MLALMMALACAVHLLRAAHAWLVPDDYTDLMQAGAIDEPDARADALRRIAYPLATALTLGGVIVSLRAIFGTYQGWNSAAYFCEEVRNPGSSIARATFSGIAVVAVIYVLANLAYMSVLSPAEMGELFKVIAFGRGIAAPLSGFSRGDKSHTL